MSINRAGLTSTGQCDDGITWQGLQPPKNQAGFAASEAIDITPVASDDVEESNTRHWWQVPRKIPMTKRS